jgi:hypothetical protein
MVLRIARRGSGRGVVVNGLPCAHEPSPENESSAINIVVRQKNKDSISDNCSWYASNQSDGELFKLTYFSVFRLFRDHRGECLLIGAELSRSPAKVNGRIYALTHRRLRLRRSSQQENQTCYFIESSWGKYRGMRERGICIVSFDGVSSWTRCGPSG